MKTLKTKYLKQKQNIKKLLSIAPDKSIFEALVLMARRKGIGRTGL